MLLEENRKEKIHIRIKIEHIRIKKHNENNKYFSHSATRQLSSTYTTHMPFFLQKYLPKNKFYIEWERWTVIIATKSLKKTLTEHVYIKL